MHDGTGNHFCFVNKVDPKNIQHANITVAGKFLFSSNLVGSISNPLSILKNPSQVQMLCGLGLKP